MTSSVRRRRSLHGGLRLYCLAGVDRLPQVVAYRRLGLGLEDIAAALAEADAGRALERQRELVEEKITELTRLLAALDTALEKDMRDIDLTEDEMRELFGEHYTEHFAEYQEEAEQRWGQTDAWAEDPRFAATYDQLRPGLAQYLRDAIHAHADRLPG